MASTIDGIKNDLLEAINASQRKTSAYDTQAEVVRIEGNTAWVHIGGGVTETPVQLTINAQKGDKVQVRVSNEGAWIMGNATAPPTDDAKANEADKKAAEAKYLAVDAADAAIKADIAAQDAVASAEVARTAAQTAIETAESVEEIAVEAQENATSAYNSASQAINQLSVVENIVGVLDLVSKNGEYALTSDTEIQADKWYFTRSGSGTSADPYVYTVVANPVVADIASYYELVSINQAIQNYVSSHLALTNDGLYLQNGATRILLSTTDGLVLYDQTGKQIANYGTEAVIGDPQGFHITITPNYNNTGVPRLSFYRDAVNEIAYISGDKLYITQSVVLQQMDVGTPANDGGLGQWSWKVHEVNGANNLYLKWLG